MNYSFAHTNLCGKGRQPRKLNIFFFHEMLVIYGTCKVTSKFQTIGLLIVKLCRQIFDISRANGYVSYTVMQLSPLEYQSGSQAEKMSNLLMFIWDLWLWCLSKQCVVYAKGDMGVSTLHLLMGVSS